MSENTNIENTTPANAAVNAETGTADVSAQNESTVQLNNVPETVNETKTCKTPETQQTAEQADQTNQAAENLKNNQDENNITSQEVKDLAQKVRDYIREISAKEKSELAQSLVKYDNEKYLQNREFKNLYKAAYAALGKNLDTEKFISLVDNYVNSRITAYQNVKNMELENETATDKMQFQSGHSKKSEVLPQMQDIAPDELNEYIYKYI